MPSRYKSLEAVARWYSLIGWLNLIIGLGIATVLIMSGVASRTFGSSVIAAGGTVIATLFVTVTCWAVANLIRLAIDCEDHLRTVRVLQKAQHDELMR